MKSDNMKVHLERNAFLYKLNTMDKDEIDKIEFDIA